MISSLPSFLCHRIMIMKIDRLFGITLYLLNHNKANAKVLAERFEVSLRTIQRDIEALCQAGIPIVSSFGVDGGYEILDSFKMERQLVGNNDYSFIITALQGLASAYKSPQIDAVLEKMIALSFDRHTDSHIVLDFSVLQEKRNTGQQLKILENAIVDKRVVSFSYTNADNQLSSLEVEPIAVTYKWYAWYLLAYTAPKNDYRLYKLIRMNDLKITNKSIPNKHKIADALIKKNNEQDTREYIDIKILCKAEIRMPAIEYLNGTIEKEYENSDFIMKLHLPKNEHFWFGTLLSFGNLVQVIEPYELKIRLYNKCNEILKLYENI